MERNVITRERVDHKIIFVMVSLISFGLVMIFSVATSQSNMGLFMKQVVCMSIGLILVYVMQHMSIDLIRPFVVPAYVVSYIFIFMLLLPKPFTRTVNGATRWLNFGVAFQVAEFVKIAVIIMLAYTIEQNQSRKDGIGTEFLFILRLWVLGGLPTGLLLIISDDLSSSMVIAGITFMMSFVSSRGGFSWLLHIGLALLVVLGVTVAVIHVSQNLPTEAALMAGEVSFRTGRVAAWLHPENYTHSVGFQPTHCLYAIANGGWLGKGLGQSWQKSILPESENDVIFAIIIEELGIFGGIVLIGLFGVLVSQMSKVASRTKDLFGRMIVVGIIGHIMLQVIIHCGVCTNLLPNTGIGLPFISSGMTASFLQLAEMTLVLAVAREYIFRLNDQKSKMRRASREERRSKTPQGSIAAQKREQRIRHERHEEALKSRKMNSRSTSYRNTSFRSRRSKAKTSSRVTRTKR